MAVAAFTPRIAPSPGTRRTQEVNLLTAEFGDGYSQSAPAGMNHIRRVLTLTWEALTKAQHDEIVEFFKARGGYQPFLYMLPGEQAAIQWTCKEWDYGTSEGVYAITATFKQDFGLA